MKWLIVTVIVIIGLFIVSNNNVNECFGLFGKKVRVNRNQQPCPQKCVDCMTNRFDCQKMNVINNASNQQEYNKGKNTCVNNYNDCVKKNFKLCVNKCPRDL